MIKASTLVRDFQTMYRERWRYEWGKHEQGCVDCSGAFTYAFEKHGANCPNGSNYIARYRIQGRLLPVSEAKPGMAAFKKRAPGDSGYNLPEKYKPGGKQYNGDLNDYYHIGLVDEDPGYVLNAKGTDYGFCRDPIGGKRKWDCVAYLKGVEYPDDHGKGEEQMGTEAKVALPSGAKGDTVNLRTKPSTSGGIITKVPVGATVEVVDDIGQWCRITYNGKTGYMMSNYIEYAGQADETGTITPEDAEKIDGALSAIEKYLDEIREQTEIIGSITGRG